jgi:predicted secreted protein
MTITAVIVVYAVLWFLCLFVILPLRLVTQHDTGEVIPGTAPSAPVDAQMGRKLRLATIWATVLWAIACGVILSGVVEVADLDFFGRMHPAP